MLYHIWVGQIGYENIYLRLKIVFGDKNIDLLLSEAGEKVGNLFLYVCSSFQNNSCNDIPKNIVNYNAFIIAHALK
jgi:hypothetical protein